MNKFLATAFGLICATTLSVSAQNATPSTNAAPAAPSAPAATAPATSKRPAKHVATAEEKAERKEIIAKYDLNKDGKLDTTERAKMTKEDKQKLAKLQGGRRAKAE